MACIASSVIGKFTGSLGGITAKKRHGEYYLSAKPASFIPGYDKASVLRRMKFRILTGFGQTVLSCKELKYFWKISAAGKLNSHNMFIKENYRFLNDNGLTNNNRITPSCGLTARISSLFIENVKLIISSSPVSESCSFYDGIEINTKFAAVIFSHNGNPLSSGDYNFQLVESDFNAIRSDLPLLFEISLEPPTLYALTNFQYHKFFSALILFQNNNSPESYFDYPAYDLLN